MTTYPPVLDIIYNFDTDKLKLLADSYKDKAKGWIHPLKKYEVKNWKTFDFENEYTTKIKNELNIQASSKFVFQSNNYLLKPHVDVGTLCSINVILQGFNDPVIFEDKEYYYTQAFLNVQATHSVYTTEERIIFKMSIRNKSFNDLIHDKYFSSFLRIGFTNS